MVTIIREGVVNAPVVRVQRAFDDFTNIYKFHPAVRLSEAVGASRSGVGTERVCHTYDGQAFHERLVQSEEGRWVVHVLKGMPARHAQATITAKALDRERTALRFVMEIDFPFPMSLMAPLVKRRFGKIISQLIVGLGDHLDTGREIVERGKLGEPIEPIGVRPAAA